MIDSGLTACTIARARLTGSPDYSKNEVISWLRACIRLWKMYMEDPRTYEHWKKIGYQLRWHGEVRNTADLHHSLTASSMQHRLLYATRNM